MKCYCGLENRFEDCCQPYIAGQTPAPTAEALMRSRYSAYCISDADYLLRTTHPTTRLFHRKSEILAWSKANTWLQLEVVQASTERVTFKAIYLDAQGQRQEHFEKSRFQKQHGKWYYVDGTFG